MQSRSQASVSRTAFFHSKPPAVYQKPVQKQSHHDRLALREHAQIAARRQARTAAEVSAIDNFDPYPTLIKASRPPPPPGWKAHWDATAQFGDSRVESRLSLPVLRLAKDDSLRAVSKDADMTRPKVLKHSTHR